MTRRSSHHWVRRNRIYVPSDSVAAPAFDPLTITGLEGFWRADAGITRAGANVTNWVDQKNGYSGGISGSPQWGATSFNGAYNGVSIDTGVSVTPTVGSASLSTITIFVLGSMPNLAGNSGMLDFEGEGRTQYELGTIGMYGYDNADGTNGFYMYDGGGGGPSNPSVTTGAPMLLGLDATGTGASHFWKNGAAYATGADNFSNLAGTSGRLHAGVDVTGSVYAAWGYASTILTPTDWSNLKGWCNTTFGTSF